MKGLAIFLIGLAAGAIWGKYYYEGKYKLLKEIEIEKIKNELTEALNHSEEKSSSDPDESSTSLNTPYEKQEFEDYTAYSGTSYMNHEEKMAEKEHPREDDIDDRSDIHEISIDTYITSNGNKNIELTYYVGSDLLENNSYNAEVTGYTGTNLDELEIIDDEYPYLGDVLTTSGFKFNEVPVIYIRNPELKIDFQITKFNGTFE